VAVGAVRYPRNSPRDAFRRREAHCSEARSLAFQQPRPSPQTGLSLARRDRFFTPPATRSTFLAWPFCEPLNQLRRPLCLSSPARPPVAHQRSVRAHRVRPRLLRPRFRGCPRRTGPGSWPRVVTPLASRRPCRLHAVKVCLPEGPDFPSLPAGFLLDPTDQRSRFASLPEANCLLDLLEPSISIRLYRERVNPFSIVAVLLCTRISRQESAACRVTLLD
jgi:hypothetical protein